MCYFFLFEFSLQNWGLFYEPIGIFLLYFRFYRSCASRLNNDYKLYKLQS